MEKYLKVYDVTVVGIRPLLHNRFVMEKSGEKTTRKVAYIPEDEAKKSLNLTEDGKLFQPATHFEGAMQKEAVNFKLKGQKTYKDAVKAGVEVLPVQIVHKNQNYEIDTRPVVIKGNRVPKSRAVQPEWELDFEIHVVDERIASGTLKDILENAGRFSCVGDYRPKFGKFEVIKFEERK